MERHAWRTMGTRAQTNCDEFDPMSLHAAFERMIRDLREKNLQMHKKIEKLEMSCKDEEKRHWQRVTELQRKNQVLFLHLPTPKCLHTFHVDKHTG